MYLFFMGHYLVELQHNHRARAVSPPPPSFFPSLISPDFGTPFFLTPPCRRTK